MKTILIVNTVNTGFTGITSVILNYVRATKDVAKYDFVLAGKVEHNICNELQEYGKHCYLPPCSRVKKPLWYTMWLLERMRENDYDAVHVHGNSGTMFFEMFAASIAGIPIRICHSHSSSCKFRFAHKILKPLMNRLMTTGIACSDKAGEWLFTKEYVLMPNGIDVSQFRFSMATRTRVREQLGVQNDFVVGHVGYMDVEKNHSYLISLFELLIQLRPNSKLLLIGDGKLRQTIEQQIKQTGLQNKVLVLGRREDTAQLYQCMDVFVLPSLFEGLPVSLLEAQTAGLPCIVSDKVTKQVDIIGNMKFLPISAEGIFQWVEELLTISENGREKYAKIVEKSDFNIQKCVKKLLILYGMEENVLPGEKNLK